MAVQSGSFNTTAYSNRYLTFAWTLKSQDIATNTSTIEWTLKGAGSASGYYLTQNITLIINGTTVYTHGLDPQIKLWNGTLVASGTTQIAHGSTGTKTFSASCEAGIYVWSPNCSGSGSWELPTIPRYATISQSLASKTETTAVINWTSDSTCDYLWYSSDNGSSWTGVSISNASSGQYTISGLTANTTYNIKTRVRRKDSQLTTDSSALSVTTYKYPYATTMPNFTIGDKVTIGLYNPLGRTVTVEMLGADNSSKSGGSVSGTSISGFNASAWQTFLYASIPSSKTGTYKIRVTYGTQVNTANGGTYTIKESDCLPVIGAVTYQDTNSTITSITGDSTKIVNRLSTVMYTATGLAGSKSATISSCSVSVNGNTYTMTRSGTTATGGNASISSAQNVTATVTVTDSRGLTASKSVTVTIWDWYMPSAIITLKRHDNYYTATDITVDAQYAYVNGLNTVTITYKARKTGTSSWTVTGTLSDNVLATFQADNNYSWDVEVTLTDRFGGSTYAKTYTLVLPRGLPIIYFDHRKSSVGINCFPSRNTSLEVNGLPFSRQIITRGLSSDWTYQRQTSDGARGTIPLSTTTLNGDLLTASGNGVLIGTGITKVLVSAHVTIKTVGAETYKWLYIVKNGTTAINYGIGVNRAWVAVSKPFPLTVTPILAEVVAGDIITLQYDIPMGSSDVILGESDETYLTVEAVY